MLTCPDVHSIAGFRACPAVCMGTHLAGHRPWVQNPGLASPVPISCRAVSCPYVENVDGGQYSASTKYVYAAASRSGTSPDSDSGACAGTLALHTALNAVKLQISRKSKAVTDLPGSLANNLAMCSGYVCPSPRLLFHGMARELNQREWTYGPIARLVEGVDMLIVQHTCSAFHGSRRLIAIHAISPAAPNCSAWEQATT